MIWSYFAEFQPKAKRGSMLSFMAAFWTLGNLFVAGKFAKKIRFTHYISIIIFDYESYFLYCYLLTIMLINIIISKTRIKKLLF